MRLVLYFSGYPTKAAVEKTLENKIAGRRVWCPPKAQGSADRWAGPTRGARGGRRVPEASARGPRWSGAVAVRPDLAGSPCRRAASQPEGGPPAVRSAVPGPTSLLSRPLRRQLPFRAVVPIIVGLANGRLVVRQVFNSTSGWAGNGGCGFQLRRVWHMESLSQVVKGSGVGKS